MTELTSLSQDEFDHRVTGADRPVVVEFGAQWCGPCEMLGTILVELAEDYAGRVDFYSVNVDQNPELVMACGVMGLPTLILFRDGEPVARIAGYHPKADLEQALLADV